MSQIIVKGGRALSGSIAVQGAKNSALPILAATILNRGETVLRGCPRLRDVDASIRILRHLGCEARWEGDALVVNTAGMNRSDISDALMREMRSSAIFLGAILARCGRADLSYPGGCEFLWCQKQYNTPHYTLPTDQFYKRIYKNALLFRRV
ncbi:putative UDP-N-acetylglucosamine 1-carboxyvinyltransferase [Oscillibacter valericigenes Sjm18-20]|nr:putative UDP-N-acetylglucosamine 1-carboxyvinyltransferase [Oscillibacter valericigenes Sjm18-20]